MSLDDVLKCGSNFEMSPLCAVTSSFFWVVCASAWPPAVSGTAAAAPRAAAPLSRSRRVNSMVLAPPRVRSTSGIQRDSAPDVAGRSRCAILSGPPPPVKPRAPTSPEASGPRCLPQPEEPQRRLHVLQLPHAQVLDGQVRSQPHPGGLADDDLAVARLGGQPRRDVGGHAGG